MAYLRKIEAPPCRGCGGIPQDELVDAHERPLAYYCTACGNRALEAARDRELLEARTVGIRLDRALRVR